MNYETIFIEEVKVGDVVVIPDLLEPISIVEIRWWPTYIALYSRLNCFSFPLGSVVDVVVSVERSFDSDLDCTYVEVKGLKIGDKVFHDGEVKNVTGWYQYRTTYPVKFNLDGVHHKSDPNFKILKLKGEYVEKIKLVEATTDASNLVIKLQQLQSVYATEGESISCGTSLTISKSVLVEVLNKEIKALTNKLNNFGK